MSLLSKKPIIKRMLTEEEYVKILREGERAAIKAYAILLHYQARVIVRKRWLGSWVSQTERSETG